ncbi:hypothetical protein QGN32_02980 [Mycolicibacterium sp. ND9-15]|uniref:hypothetical protein n=1 Tax=Mycolicibacterium sp. ND9-15 TaxID=3042320 RepID=UPI002DDB27D3|nr:hypothetical protein [Mycolicibacterium sp. ND9-15]WSE56904.1 hypothetical protein QGN32_02980 [Mycolicibacterium sp. ND9-15]
MATRLSTDDIVSADCAQAAVGPLKHHRLTILAAGLADVVGLAGGWLFDRARAGWDVNVRVEGCRDVRPLVILGASAVEGPAETVLRDVACDGALAVSTRLLRADSRVRAHVYDLAKGGGAEVMAWGEDWPVELGGRIDAVEHRLSVAARAFKAQALIAAKSDRAVSATETLFDLATESIRPLYPV